MTEGTIQNEQQRDGFYVFFWVAASEAWYHKAKTCYDKLYVRPGFTVVSCNNACDEMDWVKLQQFYEVSGTFNTLIWFISFR